MPQAAKKGKIKGMPIYFWQISRVLFLRIERPQRRSGFKVRTLLQQLLLAML